MKRTTKLAISTLLLLAATSSQAAPLFEYHQRVAGLVPSVSASPEEAPVTVEPEAPHEPLMVSCKSLLDTGKSTGSGLYTLAQNGLEYSAYCDMNTDGGGWTLVAAQFDTDPVTNWGEGIQSDYDPTLASWRSFTFDASEIPTHSQVAAGKGLAPTFIDYWNFTYTTGDIPTTLITGLKTGQNYHVHRNRNSYFGYHDPEGVGGALAHDSWVYTLTFDRSNAAEFTWAFSPTHPDATRRGYGLAGPQYTIRNNFG